MTSNWPVLSDGSLNGPELVFGLVGAIGTDLALLERILNDALGKVSYRSETVRLSSLIRQLPQFRDLPDRPLDSRYDAYMGAGTTLREQTTRADVLAILGVQDVSRRRRLRSENDGNPDSPSPRGAYIVHSLKRPEEVTALRRIYNPGFFLVAAYSPRTRRIERLEQLIADSYGVSLASAEHGEAARRLVEKDESERERPLGQNVRDTFPLADFFVDVSAAEMKIRADVDRFIEIIFGYPYHTPSRDESGMFHARAAAVRSSEMGRQVGATITDEDGNVLCTGTNEVPKYGGGPYWETRDGSSDARDFVLGEDNSDRMKRNNFTEVFRAFQKAGLLKNDVGDDPVGALRKMMPHLKGTRLMNAIEFGRAVHAEMDAITSASRIGISLVGATLYTTTFPCHNCARHIIAAGISRVVYVEPYAKSLAGEFHADSISVEEVAAPTGRVCFEPFVGLAPRRYLQLFGVFPPARKDDEGKKLIWDRATSQPRMYPTNMSYIDREAEESSALLKILQKEGIDRAS